MDWTTPEISILVKLQVSCEALHISSIFDSVTPSRLILHTRSVSLSTEMMLSTRFVVISSWMSSGKAGQTSSVSFADALAVGDVVMQIQGCASADTRAPASSTVTPLSTGFLLDLHPQNIANRTSSYSIWIDIIWSTTHRVSQKLSQDEHPGKMYIDFARLTCDVYHSPSLASRTEAEVMLGGSERLDGRKKNWASVR